MASTSVLGRKEPTLRDWNLSSPLAVGEGLESQLSR